jgi:hypothetical protein
MQLKHIKGPGYSLNTHLHPNHYPRVHLLNHASEFTSHERYDRVRRQGAGHIRCKAERHIVTDSIRRRRGWQGESVSFLQRLTERLTDYEPPAEPIVSGSAIQNQILEQFDRLWTRRLPVHRRVPR